MTSNQHNSQFRRVTENQRKEGGLEDVPGYEGWVDTITSTCYSLAFDIFRIDLSRSVHNREYLGGGLDNYSTYSGKVWYLGKPLFSLEAEGIFEEIELAFKSYSSNEQTARRTTK
jgi:hypothetical protein